MAEPASGCAQGAFASKGRVMTALALRAFWWAVKSRTGQATILAVALIGGFLAWKEVSERQAVSEALTKREAAIERINNEFTSKAINARMAALRCIDAGGVFRTAESRCVSGVSDGGAGPAGNAGQDGE